MKLGTDPELVLRSSAGTYISAKNYVKGSKYEPHRVNKGAVQLDGIAAEFNIDPASSKEEFIQNHHTVLDQLAAMVAPHSLVVQPKVYFDEDYFDALSEDEKRLGCDPDMDAWSREQNTPPECNEPFRTFGGHIHYGFMDGFDHDKFDIEQFIFDFVKNLDVTLYMNSMVWDSDDDRRRLYGKMGSFRFKPYGFEFRPLSNCILLSDEILGYVWDVSQTVKELQDHGVKVFENPTVMEYINYIRRGYKLDPNTLREYLRFINQTYSIPVLGV